MAYSVLGPSLFDFHFGQGELAVLALPHLKVVLPGIVHRCMQGQKGPPPPAICIVSPLTVALRGQLAITLRSPLREADAAPLEVASTRGKS